MGSDPRISWVALEREAAEDTDFFTALILDPEAALLSRGYEPSETEGWSVLKESYCKGVWLTEKDGQVFGWSTASVLAAIRAAKKAQKENPPTASKTVMAARGRWRR